MLDWTAVERWDLLFVVFRFVCNMIRYEGDLASHMKKAYLQRNGRICCWEGC
jgi:hypothetical protein